MERQIPAIWVRFTPYLVTWAEREFGTGIELEGKHMLELRSLPGVRDAVRRVVDEDLTLTISTCNSMSQLRYEILVAGYRVNPALQVQHDVTIQELQSFLPVHVPDYLLLENGVLRRFSRLMQMRRRPASIISERVYHAFWLSLYRFSQKGGNSFAIDRDMIAAFCELNEIEDVNLDDLRNQFQRMKRQNYFLNKG